eukprot:926966_1
MGFCTYADISLIIQDAKVENIAIIDLDAHQGNGHEHDKRMQRYEDEKDGKKVFILDVYNHNIYPSPKTNDDRITESGQDRESIDIDLNGYMVSGTQYLKNLKAALSSNEFIDSNPDLIIYNAGTDCLEGDPSGMMSLTAEDIKARDEIVF